MLRAHIIIRLINRCNNLLNLSSLTSTSGRNIVQSIWVAFRINHISTKEKSIQTNMIDPFCLNKPSPLFVVCKHWFGPDLTYRLRDPTDT